MDDAQPRPRPDRQRRGAGRAVRRARPRVRRGGRGGRGARRGTTAAASIIRGPHGVHAAGPGQPCGRRCRRRVLHAETRKRKTRRLPVQGGLDAVSSRPQLTCPPCRPRKHDTGGNATTHWTRSSQGYRYVARLGSEVAPPAGLPHLVLHACSCSDRKRPHTPHIPFKKDQLKSST